MQEAVRAPGASTVDPVADTTIRLVVMFKDSKPQVIAGYHKFPDADGLISRVDENSTRREALDDSMLASAAQGLTGLAQAIQTVATTSAGDLIVHLIQSEIPAHQALGLHYGAELLGAAAELDGRYRWRNTSPPHVPRHEMAGIARLRAFAAANNLPLIPEDEDTGVTPPNPPQTGPHKGGTAPSVKHRV